MDAATRSLVWQRANNNCEYCRLPQDASHYTFHVEHIIAQQHGGGDEPENLALACNRCNLSKGPNLSSIDPDGGEVVELYHPRRDAWDDHYEIRDGEVIGRTARGRATVRLLEMNAPERVDLRLRWLDQAED